MKLVFFNFVFCDRLENQLFDYIIVGAGPGGGTVATKLASAGYKTLLMEAGPDYQSDNTRIPGFHLKAVEDPNISWAFKVEQLSFKNNVYYPRGSALGGSQLMNALVSVYPSQSDFDYMQLLTRQSEWSEPNMRKRFNKITEKFNVESEEVKSLINPLLTPKNKSKGWYSLFQANPLALLKNDRTLLEMILMINKYPKLPGGDPNSYIDGKLASKKEGIFEIPQSLEAGKEFKRNSVYDHIKKTKKLTVWTGCLATRILLDKNNNAFGIEYLKGHHLYQASPLFKKSNLLKAKKLRVYAKREVIISAGAFNTPQLLMLSGIGDRRHLSEKGIKSKVHLKGVGKNLQDRYEIPYTIEYKEDFTFRKFCNSLSDKDPCLGLFKKDGHTAYGTNVVIKAMINRSSKNMPDPDLFTIITPATFTGYYKGFSKDAATIKNRLSFVVLKSHTKNRAGEVKLKSRDPSRTPKINFNYFAQGAGHDLNVLVDYLFYLRKTLAQFSVLNGNKQELYPGLHVQTRDQMQDYIIKNSWGHHACCTAKMGSDRDPLSVLDFRFKVIHSIFFRDSL